MPINKTPKKKNGLQGYRVRVSYTVMNGKYQQVERTVYEQAEAQLMEKQLLTEYKERKEVSKSKMTISQLIDKYENPIHKIPKKGRTTPQ